MAHDGMPSPLPTTAILPPKSASAGFMTTSNRCRSPQATRLATSTAVKPDELLTVERLMARDMGESLRGAPQQQHGISLRSRHYMFFPRGDGGAGGKLGHQVEGNTLLDADEVEPIVPSRSGK